MKERITQRKTRQAVSNADCALLVAFRHAIREFLHFSEEAALVAGVAPQQHQAMLAIRGSRGCDHLTVGELAGQLKIKHNSAVGLVNRMESDGLVKKSQGPNDRRQMLVRFTAHGERTSEKLSPIPRTELARIGPTLRKILDQLEAAS